MEKLLLVLFVLGFAAMANAQIKNPVEWKYEAKKKGDGPVPKSFTFAKNPLVTLVGNVEEVGKLEKVYDNAFKTDVLFYSNSVKFTQQIKVKAGVKTNLAGTVEYMVCNDEQCLPPTKKPFNIGIN